MHILHRSNYLVFFDDVRVDPFLIEWNSSLALFADGAGATVTLHRAPRLNEWKAYLTQVRIFTENPFTKKFCMVFEGEIANRSWSESRSNSGTVSYTIKGFYHWLDIPVPMGITYDTEYSKVQKFIYEAQNIDIDSVRELMISRSDAALLDRNIDELIKDLYNKLTIGYYDVAGENTTLSFANILERFKVMVDVKEDFRNSGFLDLFTFTNVNNVQSFYEYLNNVLSSLMFEFYQDRDGSFRIKTPSWGDAVLKAHVLDASLISKISGMDAWDKEPTRVLAMGGESQMLAGNSNLNSSLFNQNLTIPIGLYVGDPRNPETEMYYSQLIDGYMENYGASPNLSEEDTKYFNSGEWFDNTSNYKITSEHRSKSPTRRDHYGIDFNYRYEPIYSIGTSGTVKKIGYDGPKSGRGYYIQIEQFINGERYTFQYGHLNASSSDLGLKTGDVIRPGQKIGVSGNTGQVVAGPGGDGAHLHFEIWKGDAYKGSDLHPLDFLKSVSIKSDENNLGDFRKHEEESMKTVSTQTTTKTTTPANEKSLLASVGVKDATGNAGSWQNFHISAYTAYCTGCSGITASGVNVRDQTIDHRVVAVDPKVISLGSIVEIEGLGYYTAADTGGAIKGNKLDLLVRSKSDANAWGRRNMRVRVVRSGKGDSVNKMANTPSPHTLVEGPSSASSNGNFHTNMSKPKAGVSSSSSMNVDFKVASSLPSSSSATNSNYKTNSFANIDSFAVDRRFAIDSILKQVEPPVGLKGKLDKLVYSIPSYAPYGTKDKLASSPHGIDGNLLASIIDSVSSWREKHNAGNQVGILGIPKSYAEDVLVSVDLLDAKTNIEEGAKFLSNAMSRFNGKTTFALAAYHMGGFNELAAAVTKFGAMDFAAMRKAGLIPSDTLAFVDKVLGKYLNVAGADFIEGDPHKEIKTATTQNSEVPEDFDDSYKLTLSDEERRFKIKLVRVEQPLIRIDNDAVGSSDMAEKLIYLYAKYMMMLHRAQSHSVTCQLTTCLPFLRPGYNVWIEPTRTDVVGYITGITHSGSFGNGCYTSVTSGFIRRPDDYTEIDSSIFASTPRATSDSFGKLLTNSEMNDLRDRLKKMHELDGADMAHNFDTLKDMYSSMNLTNEFTTQWNAEMTKEEIIEKINVIYTDAPDIVKTRKEETKKVFEASEDFFIEKLLFERRGANG